MCQCTVAEKNFSKDVHLCHGKGFQKCFCFMCEIYTIQHSIIALKHFKYSYCGKLNENVEPFRLCIFNVRNLFYVFCSICHWRLPKILQWLKHLTLFLTLIQMLIDYLQLWRKYSIRSVLRWDWVLSSQMNSKLISCHTPRNNFKQQAFQI